MPMREVVYYFSLSMLFNIFVFSEYTYAKERQMGKGIEDVVFSQKGGMLLPKEQQVFVRTNDEWTGFSTFYVGYRYSVNRYFNVGFEAAASPIPHVYLVSYLMHFKLFESNNKRIFIGAKTHMGYKYQDSDFSSEKWVNIVNEDYLVTQRNGVFFVLDLTAAIRFGDFKRFAFYYTVYPKLDVDLVDENDRLQFMFSPGMLGFEFRFRKNPMWSFAAEIGYTIPIPWSSIPKGRWVNFPSLGNLGFYYRF